jgi:hypothetical protein
MAAGEPMFGGEAIVHEEENNGQSLQRQADARRDLKTVARTLWSGKAQGGDGG